MMMDDENTQVLNFKARMLSDYPEDRRRQFMVSYFLSDKTMQIIEAVVPNSGFRAGKFLQRTRIRDPATKKFFEPSAFYVGAKIHAAGRVFELLDAAQHTFNLMEAKADEFPDSDIGTVVNHIKQICLGETKNLRKLFQERDDTASGYLTMEEAEDVLSKFEPKISKHAVKTVLRAFERDGKFEYNPLLTFIKN